MVVMVAKEGVNAATNPIAIHGFGGNVIADQNAETMVFFNLISTEARNQKSVHPKFPALQQARDIVFSFEVIRARKHVKPINICDLLHGVEIRCCVRFWWTCALGSRECVNVCVD